VKEKLILIDQEPVQVYIAIEGSDEPEGGADGIIELAARDGDHLDREGGCRGAELPLV
jgi:hypothetical protein